MLMYDEHSKSILIAITQSSHLQFAKERCEGCREVIVRMSWELLVEMVQVARSNARFIPGTFSFLRKPDV